MEQGERASLKLFTGPVIPVQTLRLDLDHVDNLCLKSRQIPLGFLKISKTLSRAAPFSLMRAQDCYAHRRDWD